MNEGDLIVHSAGCIEERPDSDRTDDRSARNRGIENNIFRECQREGRLVGALDDFEPRVAGGKCLIRAHVS